MATHSSTPAWRIPWTEEPGGLQSMGLQRIREGHDRVTFTCTFLETVKSLPAMQETWVRSLGWEDPWRRKWQPTPVFLLGESHGQRSLVGYSLWGRRVGHDWVTEQQQQ